MKVCTITFSSRMIHELLPSVPPQCEANALPRTYSLPISSRNEQSFLSSRVSASAKIGADSNALKEVTACAIPTAREKSARKTLKPPKNITPQKVY